MLSKIGNIVLIGNVEWTVVRPRDSKPAAVRTMGRRDEELTNGTRIVLTSLKTGSVLPVVIVSKSFHPVEGYTEIELQA